MPTKEDALQAEATTVDTATGEAAPAELSQDRAHAIFTQIARQYEDFNHKSSFGQDRVWLARLVDAAPITSASRVLDVAGGTGEVTFAVCAKKPPASVLLSDYTQAMLDVAQARIERGDGRGVPVETMVVDGQDMPFEAESFDVVTMAYGVRNMPDRMACLKEIHRVLVPGGAACILEFATPPNAFVRFFHDLYLKHGVPFWGERCCGNREDFEYLASSIMAFPPQERFMRMLSEAGFADVSCENQLFGTAAIYTATKAR